MKKRNRGFTLLELMATIALAAVLFGLAIPSLGNWIRDSRLTRFSNDFVTASHLARTEAIKRRVPVTICAIDPNDPSSCAANGQFRGWIVFVDEDGDWDIDAANEEILQSYAGPPAAVTVDSGERRVLSFADSGFARRRADAIAQMVVCDSRGNAVALGDQSTARLITVAPTGRPSISRERAQISALESELCPDPS